MPDQTPDVNKIRTARLGDYIAMVSYAADGRELSTITVPVAKAVKLAREIERRAQG